MKVISDGVLGEIGRASLQRVERYKLDLPMKELEKEAHSSRLPFQFMDCFKSQEFNVIAEVKRASPSQGDIELKIDPEDVAGQYLHNGAKALSILTEPQWFQGDIKILRNIRKCFPEASILMKDFFVDEYQLFQARCAGADAVLVMISLLGVEQSATMVKEARNLGLTPLVEVHDLHERDAAIGMGADLVGINNRNLKDLSIDLTTTEQLMINMPSEVTAIGESGIKSGADMKYLKSFGVDGFLIGTSLMASGRPGEALSRMLSEAGQ